MQLAVTTGQRGCEWSFVNSNFCQERHVLHKLQQGLWERYQNGALPSFNDDAPFAVRSLPVIVSIYLSMKQSRPIGVQREPRLWGSIFKAQRLFHITACSDFDGKCVLWGARMKDTWLSRGRPAPRYPYRFLQHLCSLMVALPRGVY